MQRRLALACALAVVLVPVFLGAEEGMWTFDNPPLKQLKEKYGFEPTQAWLDHLRLASVRFNDGGSGSFVSPDGLVLTNHHVARGQLQAVSTPAHDYPAQGFLARTEAQEIKCPDLELNVLQSMEDVTARIEGIVKPGMSERDALTARRAEIARLEKESLEKTGLRSDVVTLYQGGEYWLYRYRKFTDIRIVFAPEQQIAFFGGDPDNFTYPRYDLDMALFRVYENGKPFRPDHYLRWNRRGAADGELVFVSGHPGTTNRLATMAQLEYARDVQMPMVLSFIAGRLAALQDYATAGPEAARQVQNLVFSLQNAQKSYQGQHQGLLDKTVMARKAEDERDLRSRVEADPAARAAYGDAWTIVAQVMQKAGSTYRTRYYRNLRRSQARLPQLAATIVQYAAEVPKPDAQRLPGYHDAQLESLRFSLLSPAPTYPEMEKALLASWLQAGLQALGPDDPYITIALGGRRPDEVARELVDGTTLADPAVRKALLDGGQAAVDASTDPQVVLARRLDPLAREQQEWEAAHIEAPLTPAGEKIGRARFAIYGKTVSPDATFTLRLSYGTVKGYPMNGTIAPPTTTLFGLYDRSLGFSQKPPFDLPERFNARRDRLDLTTPVNFVTTNDIIGGNSGSPVVNRQGELVGLIFDGNIESLVGTYVYNEQNNRSVAVHSAVIIEALRKLYDAGALADAIEGRRPGLPGEVSVPGGRGPRAAMPHPLGSRARILLASVFGPYARDDDDGSRSINPMELYHNQVTRVQGAFSIRMFHRSWGLMLIQANVAAPCALLDFPTEARFVEELRQRRYDVIGISSITTNLLKVRRMCEIARRMQPAAAVVVGGHITQIPDLHARIDADWIVHGDGVRWFREYLGEDPRGPIRHPVIPTRIGTRNLGVSLREADRDVAVTIIPSVGCPVGCNFCATSSMFGGAGHHVDFYRTGDELFDLMCQIEALRGTQTFFVMDENFLLDQRRARRLLELVEAHDKAWIFYVFSSAGAIRAYAIEELVALGISWVWLGLEGEDSPYAKLRGIDTVQLVRDLQAHGIRVLGSSIIGLEHHTPETLDEVIDRAVRHDADFHQFMLYMPLPGTALHAQLAAEGRLLDEDDCPIPDTHGQFRFNYRHPHIPAGLESELIVRAFQRDFDVNGPSMLRVLRTTLTGWKRYRSHPNPRIRRRFATEIDGMVPAFSAVAGAAARYYRGRPGLHARMAELLREITAEFGIRARLAAALGGPYLLHTIRREEARLARGWTYEPPTFYEINEAAASRDFPGASVCASVTPRPAGGPS